MLNSIWLQSQRLLGGNLSRSIQLFVRVQTWIVSEILQTAHSSILKYLCFETNFS